MIGTGGELLVAASERGRDGPDLVTERVRRNVQRAARTATWNQIIVDPCHRRAVLSGSLGLYRVLSAIIEKYPESPQHTDARTLLVGVPRDGFEEVRDLDVLLTPSELVEVWSRRTRN